MNIFFDTPCALAWRAWIEELGYGEFVRGYRCDEKQLCIWPMTVTVIE